MYELPVLVQFIQMESRMVIARGWQEGEMGSYCLMDIEFSFYKLKKVLEMDSSDGCTTKRMY